MLLDRPGIFILFSSTLISSIFLCIYLLFKKGINKSLKLFLLAILFFCLDNLRQFLYIYGTKLDFKPHIIHYFHFTLLVPVLILLSIDSKIEKRKIFLYALPFLFEFLLSFLILNNVINYNSYINWFAPITIDLTFFLFMIYIYSKYKKVLNNSYALKIIITFLLLSLLTSFLRIFEFIAIISNFEYFTIAFYFELTFNFFVLLIITFYITSYIIENQIKIKKNSNQINQVKKYDTFFDDSDILNLIETEEKFLDPELTIEKLAVSYNIDSKTLSNLIRKKHDLNFNGYINKLRIDFFLKLIRNGEHNKLTIFAIAEKSGFKSKSTFNRVFKENYNQTPKEYISENIK